MNIPRKIDIANLPTKIMKLDDLSETSGKNIYIKRDDQTGLEISGNKVRKLEFALAEAIDSGCNYLITCGGIQSNHARATAAVAAMNGMSSYLVLRGDENSNIEGNYFFDKLLGAKIKLIDDKDYAKNRMKIMETIKLELEKEGYKAYILPEGASNGIGSFGYYNCLLEIVEQEKSMGINFDSIVVTVGSGGTYTGLLYANYEQNLGKTIFGINICDDKEYFTNRTFELIKDINRYTKKSITISRENINILDGYTGIGYAKSTKEEINFISKFARATGIILDPVYTGKAMNGFVKELENGRFENSKNILFIHTGGIFGWSEKAIDIFSS